MIWRKSSFSDETNCVELAWREGSSSVTASVEVAVRDSKNPVGPALLFERSHFAKFLAWA
jgi:Domain of unknown function (DUF397)